MHISRTLLTIFVFAAFAPALRAEPSAISLRVEQVSSVDSEKFKKTQKRGLKVHLTNSSNQDLSGLIVKYYFFAKDVKGKDVSVLDKGEKGADVKAHATEIVETPTAEATSIEEHSEGGGGGKGGNYGASKAGKKVEASGSRLVGHGIQVFSGGKLLAEYFSEPTLKAKAGLAK